MYPLVSLFSPIAPLNKDNGFRGPLMIGNIYGLNLLVKVIEFENIFIRNFVWFCDHVWAQWICLISIFLTLVRQTPVFKRQ